MKKFLPCEDVVKRLGRAYYAKDMLMCGYSGSGIEFSFNGTAVKVELLGDDTATDMNMYEQRARAALYVDGVRMMDKLINQKEFVLEATGLENKEHVVKVLKLSECAMSTFAIKSIETDSDTICKTSAKNLFIEFIGDSITCGYGVNDENPIRNFITYTEDVTEAYAYRTAEKLDADRAFVSLSGYGIISGYTADPTQIVTNQLLPDFYEKCGYCAADFHTEEGKTLKKPEQLDWDFATYKADVCVINLGTNDDSYCQEFKDRQLFYKDEYKKFLATVRKCNPTAKILCTLGLMGERLCDYVEMAAEEYKAESGDKEVYYLRLKEQVAEDGWAADYHPTRASHEKAAVKVAEKIKEMIK